jgi:LysM repeat protein
MKLRLWLILFSLTLVMFGTVMVADVEAQTGGCSTTHIVQRGENLYRIALRYQTTVADLQARNNIGNPNRIYAGQRLCVAGGFVPPVTPTPGNPPAGIGTVTTAVLNIRSGPGLQYSILGQARYGTTYPVTGRTLDSNWYRIAYGSGGAWVFAPLMYTPNPHNLPVVGNNTPAYSAYATLIGDATTYSGPTTLTAIPPYEIFAGMTVLVIGRNAAADWLQIRTDTGTAWLRLDVFPREFARYALPVTG